MPGPVPPYDWDEAKAASNEDRHGVAFSDVTQFDWLGAVIAPDNRFDYGEPRYRALGRIGGRDHVLVYTVRGDLIRVISLRKANKREAR